MIFQAAISATLIKSKVGNYLALNFRRKSEIHFNTIIIMSKSEKTHSVVTPHELWLLSGGVDRNQPSGVDPGFKYRNGFLLLAAFYFITHLLFIPQLTLAPFALLADVRDLSFQMQMRGFYTLAVALIYAFSYAKDWHFSRVALICATLPFASLVSDAFNIYSLAAGPMAPVIVLSILIRLGVIYCLFMNSVRDNIAPPLPRSFFK